MPVPDFQSLLRPTLDVTSDRNEWPSSRLREAVALKLRLSEADLSERLPSGLQGVFDNRVGWATVYLTKARCLERPRRGVFRITERGLQLLRNTSDRIDLRILDQFEEMREFRKRPTEPVTAPEAQQDTPDVRLDQALEEIHRSLATELLERLQKASPAFFERVVVELLLSMGYGGSSKDGRPLGQAGDGGVDGVINEDKLGLDQIYIQAKRWSSGTVGRPDVQAFVGSLEMHRANKGVFLTTATFSRDASEYVERIQKKVVLVDGDRLANLMIEHNVGVSVQRQLAVKRIDSDYFEAD